MTDQITRLDPNRSPAPSNVKPTASANANNCDSDRGGKMENRGSVPTILGGMGAGQPARV